MRFKAKNDGSNFGSNGCAYMSAVAVILFVFVCVAVMLFYSYINGINRQLVNRETSLNATAATLTAKVDQLVSGIVAQFNLSEQAAEQLEEMVVSGVQAQVGPEGIDTTDALFVAVSQSYPNTDQAAAIYLEVLASLQDAQTQYMNQVGTLAQELASYESFLNDDLLRSFVLDTFFQAPSDNLRMSFGGVTHTGDDAFRIMRNVLVSEQALDALESGIMNQPDFGNNEE